MENLFLEIAEEKMDKAIEAFERSLTKVRTGRANPTMLDGIMVDYYGSPTPINQLASVSVQEGKTIAIKPFDRNVVKEVERAINMSDLGLPVQNGGEILYNITAKQLVREDNNTGRVSAVIAQRQSDGAYIKFVANKAVVMATGDFSTDRDMMAKYSPWVYEHFKDKFTWETNYDNEFVYTGLMPGDGQKMGLWIGAAWQRTFPNPCAINGISCRTSAR
jgi:ribosome recycling factor